MTVQGFRPYKFTAKDSGKEMSGVTVFVFFEDENITGRGADKFSISDERLGNWFPELGQDIELVYNKYGRVAGVQVL